jgi:hypothetical protein
MIERYKPHTYKGETPAERPLQHRETIHNIDDEAVLTEAVRDVVENVDEIILTKIFAEYYGKAGFSVENLKPVPLNQIQIRYLPQVDWFGQFHSNTQSIMLNSALLCTKDGSVNRAAVINTLIHEQLHSISSVFTQQNHSSTREYSSNVGFEKNFYFEDTEGDYEFKNQRNTVTNEGLTQILADEIQAEYTSRTGTSNDFPNKNEVLGRGVSNEAYSENQFRIRLLILFYALLSDQTEDTIKNGFIRSYLRNTDIFVEEINTVPTELEPQVRDFDLDFYLNSQTISLQSVYDKLFQALPETKHTDFASRAKVLYDGYVEALASKAIG